MSVAGQGGGQEAGLLLQQRREAADQQCSAAGLLLDPGEGLDSRGGDEPPLCVVGLRTGEQEVMSPLGGEWRGGDGEGEVGCKTGSI